MTSYDETRTALLEFGVPESMIQGPAGGEWTGGAIVCGRSTADDYENPADHLLAWAILLRLNDGSWLTSGGTARTDISASSPWPLIDYAGIRRPRTAQPEGRQR